MKALTVFGVIFRLEDIFKAELEVAIAGRLMAEQALERDAETTTAEVIASAKLAALRVMQDEIQRLHASGCETPKLTPTQPPPAGEREAL